MPVLVIFGYSCGIYGIIMDSIFKTDIIIEFFIPELVEIGAFKKSIAQWDQKLHVS